MWVDALQIPRFSAQLCIQVSLRVSLYPGNTLQEVCRSGPNPDRHAAAGLFSHMLGFYIKKPESMADRPGLFTPPCFIRVLHLHIFVFHIAKALILINIFWCNKCEMSSDYVKPFSQSTLDQTRMRSFCLQSTSLHTVYSLSLGPAPPLSQPKPSNRREVLHIPLFVSYQ